MYEIAFLKFDFARQYRFSDENNFPVISDEKKSAHRLSIAYFSIVPSNVFFNSDWNAWLWSDYAELVARGRQAVLSTLESHGLCGVERSIVKEMVIDPPEWQHR
jgi:hypothetical protein